MKGSQSYCSLNFENDSNLGGVEPWPNKLAHTLAVNAEVVDFLVGLPNLTASNFAAL